MTKISLQTGTNTIIEAYFTLYFFATSHSIILHTFSLPVNSVFPFFFCFISFFFSSFLFICLHFAHFTTLVKLKFIYNTVITIIVVTTIMIFYWCQSLHGNLLQDYFPCKSCLCVFACFFSSLSLFGSISFLYFFFLQFISTLLSLSQFHHTQIQKNRMKSTQLFRTRCRCFLLLVQTTICVLFEMILKR